MTEADGERIRERYRGLRGDMPPFGDVLTLLRLLDEARAERDAARTALKRAAIYCRVDEYPHGDSITWHCNLCGRFALNALDLKHAPECPIGLPRR